MMMAWARMVAVETEKKMESNDVQEADSTALGIDWMWGYREGRGKG